MTPKDLDAAGSRIARAASVARADTMKATTAQVVSEIQPPKLPPADVLLGKANGLQSQVESALSFATFLSAKWPYLMGAVAAYYAARVVWGSGWIRHWRAEDAATGKTVGVS